MNKERLTVLANHLRTVAPENFDLSRWSCGPVGCAVGHACTIPEFQAEGLRLSWARPHPPEYAGSSSWPAVRAFFGLTSEQADSLFDSEHYPPRAGPDNVADSIDEFVRSEA